ncbi:hypothetical protein QBC35DRAFT_147596 [Podospora australis]|uniref:Uncharacterized protein n=1 Tax=Podospora australis TaxID=1536484 RepID=A0AAN6WJ96_9PEZI|nr:hypothetical protein QBC35DRAFT_147596 [Podospora australis]
MNTEQQWGFVWCTLFPGVPRPDSIYVEDEFQEALVAVRKVWEQKKEDIIPDVISRVPMGGRDEDAVQQMQSILRGLVEDVFDRVEMELLVAKASNSSSNNSSQNNQMSAVSISAAGVSESETAGSQGLPLVEQDILNSQIASDPLSSQELENAPVGDVWEPWTGGFEGDYGVFSTSW